MTLTPLETRVWMIDWKTLTTHPGDEVTTGVHFAETFSTKGLASLLRVEPALLLGTYLDEVADLGRGLGGLLEGLEANATELNEWQNDASAGASGTYRDGPAVRLAVIRHRLDEHTGLDGQRCEHPRAYLPAPADNGRCPAGCGTVPVSMGLVAIEDPAADLYEVTWKAVEYDGQEQTTREYLAHVSPEDMADMLKLSVPEAMAAGPARLAELLTKNDDGLALFEDEENVRDEGVMDDSFAGEDRREDIKVSYIFRDTSS